MSLPEEIVELRAKAESKKKVYLLVAAYSMLVFMWFTHETTPGYYYA